MKKGEKQPDLALFDDAEYINGIDVLTAGNGNIGALTFRTTKKDANDSKE